jgi:Heme/copper-type cytochrome/quinol oxidase, subunit 3
MADPKHDYHLVEPSPWPVVGALGVLVMGAGAVFWLNKSYAGFGVLAGIPWIFAIGLVLVLYTAAGWLRDVMLESVAGREHTPVVKLSLRYGMVLLLLAVVMFFAIWGWAWFHFALFPHDAGHDSWPPAGLPRIDPWQLPFLCTVIFLTSMTAVTWAGRALQQGDRTAALFALSVTVALGAGFVAVLGVQMAHAPFGFGFSGAVLQPFTDAAHRNLGAGQGNLAAAYSSIFFFATGLAGLAAAIGVVFLAVCLGRTLAGHFTPLRHFGFDAAAWYWRTIGAIWLVLFAVFYVFGGA